MSDDKDDKDPSENPLVVAQLLDTSLKSLEKIEEREEVVKAYKDKFIAQRLEVSAKVEEVRYKALEKLVESMDDRNVSMTHLIKIIEILGKGGEADLQSLSSNDGGVNVNFNNQTANIGLPSPAELAEGANPMKSLGQTLEAMQAITSGLDMKDLKNLKDTIEGEFTEIDKKDE